MNKHNNTNMQVVNSDLLVLNYQNKSITVYDQFDLLRVSKETRVDVGSIMESLQDHHTYQTDDDVMILNGSTFINVSDFTRRPIQCSLGSGNPSVETSIQLYKTYSNYMEPVEVYDIVSGEITGYPNLQVALMSMDRTLYDLLKFPINSRRQFADISQYVFPIVTNDFIVKLNINTLSWNQYMALATDDWETADVVEEMERIDSSLDEIAQMSVDLISKCLDDKDYQKAIQNWYEYFIDKLYYGHDLAQLWRDKALVLAGDNVRLQEGIRKLYSNFMDDVFIEKTDHFKVNEPVLPRNKDSETFISEKARLLFYLNQDGRCRQEGLGIEKIHYCSRRRADEWRDQIADVISDDPDGMAKLTELWRHMTEHHSLLYGAPGGLSRHIEVYPNVKISEEEFIMYCGLRKLPFYTEYCGVNYLFILGSDITVNWNVSPNITVDEAAAVVQGCHQLLKEAYDHLEWREDELLIHIIGQRTNPSPSSVPGKPQLKKRNGRQNSDVIKF